MKNTWRIQKIYRKQLALEMRSRSFGSQKLFTLILQNSCNKYTSTHTTNTTTIALTMETTLIKATTSTHTTSTTNTTLTMEVTLIKAIIKTP